jgi:hypothetical protein
MEMAHCIPGPAGAGAVSVILGESSGSRMAHPKKSCAGRGDAPVTRLSLSNQAGSAAAYIRLR